MLVSFLLVGYAALGASGTYFVATTGDDANVGTEEAPFATIQHARDAVRTDIAAGLTSEITVVLREGTYPLTGALTLGPEDSGSEEFGVTYRAYPDESVTVSGGRALTGWEKGKNNQWTLAVPEAANGAWRFRQLFRDGERLSRGRFPNAPELLRVAGVSEDLTGIVLSTTPGMENLAGSNAELVMYQNWSISRVRIASSADRTLKMEQPVGWVGHGDATSASTNKPTYLENALAFVDAPGEWYLDETTGVITYQAAEGEDPNTRSFVAPVADQLINVLGTRERPVRNVHFIGINFAHTHWQLPDFGYLGIQAGHYGTTIKDPTYVLPLALSFIYAEDCSVAQCTITNTGACGIGFGAGTKRNRVDGCTLTDIGGSGIMVGWRGTGEMIRQSEGEDGYLSADWANPADIPTLNEVTGNLLERCGAISHGCVGIFAAFSDTTSITHNVVRDMPYTGISAGFRWNDSETSQRGTLIAYNHVHDVMQMLADGGCLYTLGYQPGSVIVGNTFHGARRSPYAHGGAPNNGIFFDEGSKGFHVVANTIYDTSGEAIRFNQTNDDNMTWAENRYGVGQPAKSGN